MTIAHGGPLYDLEKFYEFANHPINALGSDGPPVSDMLDDFVYEKIQEFVEIIRIQLGEVEDTRNRSRLGRIAAASDYSIVQKFEDETLVSIVPVTTARTYEGYLSSIIQPGHVLSDSLAFLPELTGVSWDTGLYAELDTSPRGAVDSKRRTITFIPLTGNNLFFPASLD